MGYSENTANRVTLAVAALPQTFSRADIECEAGVSGGAMTRPLRGLERLGMSEVVAVGKHGAKTWRKTPAYRPPQGPVRLGTTNPRFSGEIRQQEQAAALNAIGQCLKGWLPRSARAATDDQEAACA